MVKRCKTCKHGDLTNILVLGDTGFDCQLKGCLVFEYDTCDEWEMYGEKYVYSCKDKDGNFYYNVANGVSDEVIGRPVWVNKMGNITDAETGVSMGNNMAWLEQNKETAIRLLEDAKSKCGICPPVEEVKIIWDDEIKEES